MEEKYSAVYDLLISDSAENCVNKLADINIFITGEIRNKEMDHNKFDGKNFSTVHIIPK